MSNYAYLIEENSQLKKALHTSKNLLEKNKSDLDTIKTIYEEHKIQYARLKQDYD